MGCRIPQTCHGDWQFLQIQKKGGCIAGDRVGDGNFEELIKRVAPYVEG